MQKRKTGAQTDTPFKVLYLLEKTPDITQRQLALKVGISVGALNYCLKALIEKGWVKIDRFCQSKNKLGYSYLLTPEGMAHKINLTSYFLKQKIIEYDQLKVEIAILKKEHDVQNNHTG